MSIFAQPQARSTRLLTGLVAAALLCAAPLQVVHAGAVRYYEAGSVPSPDVVAAILGQRKPAPAMKMRGIALLNEPAAQEPIAADGGRNVNDDPDRREQALSGAMQSAVQGFNARFAMARTSDRAEPSAVVQRPTALAVAVNFDNDSARLQPSAAPALDAVAEGLRRAGFSHRFVIEGHTSATGSLAHNLKLSVERARSVKRYLVQRQGIPASALRTVGLGPRMPLNAADPSAPENRRVQFRVG